MKLAFLFILFVITFQSVYATDYYCDPGNGNIHNNGSQNSPWPELEDVFNAGKVFQSGDVIYLLDGYHGNVSVKGVHTDFVWIKNYPGANPKLSLLKFGTSAPTSKWFVEGLIIGAEFNVSYHKSTLLFAGEQASSIKIKNCTIFSKEDISAWTIYDWNNNVSNGVIFNGTDCSIENSIVKNVRTGIQFGGENCTASNNIVKNFAGDGLRGLADYGTFEYNIVKDNYVIDTNHDDGFQSWSDEGGIGKGIIKNIVLQGNTFINYTDPNREFLGPMQGVFGTDGMFEDFIIENNVVIVDHWHGISLYGATNCKIVNNTVIDAYFGTTYPNHPDPNVRGPLGPAWVKIANHKDGTQSTGNVIRNNIANQIVLENANVGVQDHNLILRGDNSSDYEVEFVDWQNFDFHLKENASAINSGSEDLAPVLDADKNSRPEGAAFDIGAYEYSGSLGVDDEFLKNSLIIYPTFNNDGKFKLQMQELLFGKLTLSLFSLQGSKIDELKILPNSNMSYFQFDNFNHLNPGIYYILAQSDTCKSIIKIIKFN